MNKTKKLIIALNLVLLGSYFIYAVVNKEKTLSNGNLILLPLAPVDPRSLMQGDYMALNYELTQEFSFKDGTPKRGYCVVGRNADGIATSVRIQENKPEVGEEQLLIKYFSNNGRINIGASSFFFQEGTSKKYEKAKFGGLKVDKDGNSVLVGLYDKNGRLIE